MELFFYFVHSNFSALYFQISTNIAIITDDVVDDFDEEDILDDDNL